MIQADTRLEEDAGAKAARKEGKEKKNVRGGTAECQL